jgi:hypothetical protein
MGVVIFATKSPGQKAQQGILQFAVIMILLLRSISLQ